MRMVKVRELAITTGAITPDPDPNLTAPAAAAVYVMTGLAGDQLGTEKDVEGHRICLRFVNGGTTPPTQIPGATGDFQVWAKDDGATAAYGAQAWCSLAAETAAKNGALYASTLKGALFIQLTAVASTGAATRVEVWLEESSSVEG